MFLPLFRFVLHLRNLIGLLLSSLADLLCISKLRRHISIRQWPVLLASFEVSPSSLHPMTCKIKDEH